MNDRIVRTIAFVLRCAGAATLAYALARQVGLPHPVWAAMSALIVLQERLDATRASLVWRILGTLIGVGAAILVQLGASRLGLGLVAQIAVGVAACALVAHSYPSLRVAMWTCPIVLLTAEPGQAIAMVGLYRGSEVILGALTGGACHWAAEAALARWSGAPAG